MNWVCVPSAPWLDRCYDVLYYSLLPMKWSWCWLHWLPLTAPGHHQTCCSYFLGLNCVQYSQEEEQVALHYICYWFQKHLVCSILPLLVPDIIYSTMQCFIELNILILHLRSYISPSFHQDALLSVEQIWLELRTDSRFRNRTN